MKSNEILQVLKVSNVLIGWNMILSEIYSYLGWMTCQINRDNSFDFLVVN